MLVSSVRLGSNVDTFKVSFIIFRDFLWWLWSFRIWGRLSVDVGGDGIMCDGSDFAHGSVSFKIEW